MKKYFIIFLGVIWGFNANAQVINVCGTDTVIFELQNYVNGIIQWEVSENDTLNWVDIEGEMGLTYKFLPTEQRFYRAKVYTTECDPIYTPISFVQLPPVSNAGSDRNCGNNVINLMANEQIGATGKWTFHYGTGIIEDITDRNTKLTANYGDSIVLVWTLTNSCGSSSDTVSLVFEELVSINEDEFIIVDNTDIIYSDSTQMANGTYIIKFSDPEIAPTENVMLIGIREDISFLEKVNSFTLQNGIYTFATEQGRMEDLFTSGTLNMGEAVNQSLTSEDGGMLPEIKGFPTRETFKTYAKKNGITPLYVATRYDTRYPEMENTANYRTKDGLYIPLPSIPIVETDHINVSIDDSYISIDPNFVLDFRLKWFKLKYLKVGVENATFEYGYNTVLAISGEETLGEWEKNIYEYSKYTYFMAGYVPVVVETKFEINASFGATVSGEVTFSREVVNSRSLTATVEGSPGNFSISYYSSNTKTEEFDFTAEGHISAELAIGPTISFKAYGFIGPYLDVPLTASADLCMDFTSGNWTATAGLEISGNLGAKAEILGESLFDFSYEIFNIPIGNEIVIPSKIKLISGYNQHGNKGSQLAKPIVVQVISSLGFPVPLSPVRVELSDGNGSVNQWFYISDLNGFVSIYWTLGTNDLNVMEVYADDCSGESLDNSPIKVNAYTPEYISNCNNSSINVTVSINNNSQTVNILPSGGYPPYQYSKDGLNWTTQKPVFNYFETGTFIVYVKDIYECIASRSFTIQPANWCKNTTLSLNYTQQGTNVALIGSGGHPPYQYSWGDQSNYGAITNYNNLVPGTYIAYIHDSRGCQKSKTITIPITAVDPMLAVYPTEAEQNVPIENLIFIWSSGIYADNQVFDLYLKTNSENYTLLASDLTESEFIYQQPLEYLTDYTWKVVVKNESGTEVHFKEFTFSTIVETLIIPEVPVIIQPQNAELIDTLTYTFKWQAQDEMVYNFYCDTIDGNILNAINLSEPEYKIERLENFSDYFWKVVVKNPISGEFASSSVYTFTTDTVDLPENFNLTYPSNSLTVNSMPISFTWDSLGNDWVYSLYLDLTDATSMLMDNIDTNSFGSTDEILDLKTYYWKVIATNTLCGHSVESPVWSFKTDTVSVPPVVLTFPANSSTVNSLPLDFTWENLGTGYFYTFYLDEVDGSTLVADNITANSYQPNALTDITNYYWKVKATKISNSKFNESAVFSFSTDTIQIPDVELISPANAATVSSLPVTLSWNDVGTNYIYSLYLDANDGSTLVTSSLTTPSYLATNLVDLTTYRWKVRATNTLNNRFEESAVFSFSTDTIQIPDVELLSPANAATVSSLPVTLSWNDFGADYVYSLYLDANDGSTLVTSSLTTPSYLTTNLIDENTYHWKVRATNILNDRFEESAVFSFSTDTVSVPTVTLTSPSNSSTVNSLPLDFSWEDLGTGYFYTFYLDEVDGSTLVADNLSANSYQATALVDLTNYFWKVKATKVSNSNTNESEVFSFYTDTIQIPDVELIAPANAATVSTLPVTLSWNNFGADYVYSLYLDTNDGSTLVTSSLTTPSYLATNLIDETTYHWKVRATNTLNDRFEESSVFSFSTDTVNVPPVVLTSPLNSSTVNSLPLGFTWEDLGTGYFYTFYLDAIDGSTLVADNLTANSYQATDLADLTNYFWKVKATKISNSYTNESEVFSFYTDTIQIPDVELISPANNSVITTSDIELTWTNLGVDYTYSVYFDLVDASTLVAENLAVNSHTVENLMDLVTYSWKIVATNTLCNRSKSSVVFSFNCEFFESVTDYEGNIYNTVVINNRRWMQENLKTTKYADGTPIPDGTGIGNYNSESTPQYYFNYNDNVANAAVYGRLYTWFTVTDPKGVCPAGWHVPSSGDFDQLKQDYTGGNFKEAGTEHWFEPNLGADNITNFTALPSGGRSINSFQNLGSFAIFWTTTDVDIYGKSYQLFYNGNDFQDGYIEKKNAYAVRCVKD